MAYLNHMKWHLFLISLLLILTAGCVGDAGESQTITSYEGTWVHESGYPVFFFQFNHDGTAYVWFMALDDPRQPGHPVMVIGSWQRSDNKLDVTYKAPLSDEIRNLHLVSEKDHLLLSGASKEDGEVIEIEDLTGIRFVRGESYSTPLMEYQSIHLV
ncbi:MAG: hypothetical protein Q7V06_02930 [Methanocalculus sp.]|nr:hypothetical protein [Methanocalculus sp.]